MTISMIMSVYDMIYSYTYVYIDVYINRLYSINDKYERSFFYRLIFSYGIIYLPHHTCMNTWNTFISYYLLFIINKPERPDEAGTPVQKLI